MPLDLNFEATTTESPVDFEQEVVPARPTYPESTKDNESALGAVMSGADDVVGMYQKLRAELDTGELSPGIENLTGVLASEDDESRKATVERFVNDPDNSPEQRAQFVEGYLIQRDRQDNLSNKFSERLFIKESDGETRTADENRMNASDLITEATESRRQEQRVYNSYLAESATDFGSFFDDFIEASLPFSQQVVTSQQINEVQGLIQGDINAVEASKNRLSAIFNLVGTKEKMKSMIDRMPTSERSKMATALSEIVTKHSGITGLNQNDFQKHITLRELTEGGYYGDTEKVLDTIVSVLDLVGLGQIGRNLLRSATARSSFEDINWQSPFDKPFPGGPSGGTGDAVLNVLPGNEPTLQGRTVPRISAREGTVGKPQPGSPFSAAKDSNPESARKLYASAMDDETGKVAKVVSGNNKSAFVHSTSLQKPKRIEDTVDEMPADLYRQGRIVDDETRAIVDFAYQPSGLGYSQFERDSASVRVYNDLKEVVGLSPRLAMSKIDNSQGFIDTTFTYGPTPDTGFTTIREALDTAEFNLRPFGINRDDMTIHIQDPITHKYIPFMPKEKGLKPYTGQGIIPESMNNTPGNFLVEVHYKRSFNPKDTDVFGTQAVVWRGIDRLTGSMFSADRFLADASTRFTKYIRNGAFRSVDKGFALENKLLSLLNTKLGKMGAESQARILDVAKESNRDRVKFSVGDALLKGLTREEANGLQDWYRFWDTVWEVDNKDLIRTMDTEGFQLFKNDKAGTKLFVKPISQTEATTVKTLYDPVNDTIVNVLDRRALDELYAKGGTVARTKRPVTINSSISKEKGVTQEPISHIITRQDSENVLRGLRSDDVALNYIPGYYKVDYGNNKYFIDRLSKDIDGNDVTQTIAASDKSGHARFARDRLNKDTPDGVTHSVRRARETKSLTDFDDAEWDLNTARGRSSQLFRNERLSAVDGGDLVSGDNLLLDPVETAHRTAASLSQRVAMRDWIESMKQRWVNDYGEFTKGIFPDSTFKIKGGGRVENDSRLADSKALHEYIRFMEQVETSTIDDAFKALNMGIAELIEGASDSPVRGMIASPFRKGRDIAPLQQMRRAAFLAYIAGNPLRQVMVQSSQMTQLMGLNPEYVGKSLGRQSMAILAAKVKGVDEGTAAIFGGSVEDLTSALKMWEDSGLHQAVQGHLLVEGAQRQALRDRAATQLGRVAQSTAQAPGAVLGISKSLGFDAGEYLNLLTGWLFARNKAVEAGLDMANPETANLIAIDAREITYGMNKAGQYSHSVGILGVMTQFMTVPQKAVFSMWPKGSQAYTPKQRRQLAALNLLAYGPPAGLFTAAVAGIYQQTGEQLIEPKTTQQIESGMADLSINWAIQQYTGKESTLDIEGAFAPGSITPFYDLIQGLMEDPLSAFASGSLLFAEKSRVGKIVDDVKFAWANPALNTLGAFSESLIIGSQFFSGLSNFWKAKAMAEHGKRYSASGRELPGNASAPEVVAQLLGVTDRVVTKDIEAFKDIAEAKDDITSDVQSFYDSAKRHILRKGVDKDSALFLESQRLFWNVYADDPETEMFAREEFARITALDAKTDTESSLIQAILKASNVMSKEKYINLVNSTGLQESTKQLLIETIDDKYLPPLGDLESNK